MTVDSCSAFLQQSAWDITYISLSVRGMVLRGTAVVGCILRLARPQMSSYEPIFIVESESYLYYDFAYYSLYNPVTSHELSLQCDRDDLRLHPMIIPNDSDHDENNRFVYLHTCARQNPTQQRAVAREYSRVQPMHSTFNLCARGTQLEAHRAALHTIAQLIDIAHPDILERVLQAGVKVRQERMHGALVLHVTRHALCDLDRGRLGKVPRGRRILMRRCLGGCLGGTGS